MDDTRTLHTVALDTIDALRQLLVGAPHALLAASVYGEEADQDYIAGKVDQMRRDPFAWIGSLDSTRRDRLVAIVVAVGCGRTPRQACVEVDS